MRGDYKKAKNISTDTRKAVLERQNFRSITGVTLSSYNVEFHHVRPRSASGVGYEWNIVAITPEEHRSYHDHQMIKVNGKNYYTWEEFDVLCRNHLRKYYCNWSIDNCKYQKNFEVKDYGVTRNEINWRC